jgi:hypothetical protein
MSEGEVMIARRASREADRHRLQRYKTPLSTLLTRTKMIISPGLKPKTLASTTSVSPIAMVRAYRYRGIFGLQEKSRFEVRHRADRYDGVGRLIAIVFYFFIS